MTSYYYIRLFFDVPYINNNILSPLINLFKKHHWILDKSSIYLENKLFNEQHRIINGEQELINLFLINSGDFQIHEKGKGSDIIEYRIGIEHREDLKNEKDWGLNTRYSDITIMMARSSNDEIDYKKYIYLLKEFSISTDCLIGLFYVDDLYDDMWNYLNGNSEDFKPSSIAFFYKPEISQNSIIDMEIKTDFIIKHNDIFTFGYLQRFIK